MVERYENTILIVKEFESIIKSQKKSIAYKRGRALKGSKDMKML